MDVGFSISNLHYVTCHENFVCEMYELWIFFIIKCLQVYRERTTNTYLTYVNLLPYSQTGMHNKHYRQST